jgi:hypothetical protein
MRGGGERKLGFTIVFEDEEGAVVDLNVGATSGLVSDDEFVDIETTVGDAIKSALTSMGYTNVAKTEVNMNDKTVTVTYAGEKAPGIPAPITLEDLPGGLTAIVTFVEPTGGRKTRGRKRR